MNKMSKSKLFQVRSVAVALSGLSLAVCTAAQAAVIKPVGATGNNAIYGQRYDYNTINGSGLSSPNMPADPVAGPWPSHNNDVNSMWLAYPKTSNPNLTIIFNLGDVYALTGAHVWNYNESGVFSNRGIKDVDVYVSNDTNNWGSKVDSWLFAKASGGSDTGTNQNFSSATAFVRYVKFVPTSDWGGDSQGLSEVRFIGSALFRVMLTSPTNNQALSVYVPVLASALPTNGTAPYSVTFCTNSVAAGTVTNAPYQVSLGTLAAGAYTVYAMATDNASGNATSVTNTFTVADLVPTVSITNPANNAIYFPGSSIVIGAAAADDSAVTNVDFYGDGSLLGSATAAPYTATWVGAANGPHALKAVAWDNAGQAVTSTVVNITLANLPPSVVITSPPNNTNFSQGASIVINATATDDDTVNQVDFYANGSLLGSDISVPYSYTWSGAALGVHALTAVATDNTSQSATSATVTVRVAIFPTTINLAPAGSGSDNLAARNWYNDLVNTVGNDPRTWIGIKWTSPQLVNALYLQAKSDNYPTNFDFQVANPGVTNPVMNTDTDWTTPSGWSFSGYTNDHPSGSSATALSTYAVRVKSTTAQTFASSELLVLKGVTVNVAPRATVGGLTGWAGSSSKLTDGNFYYDQQVYIGQVAPPPLTFDWTTPQTLGGIMISGGAGSYPTSYDVEYQDGSGNWQTAVNVWGNTTSISVAGFTPAKSAHFRVKLTGTSDNAYQRISEIMLYTVAVPLPPRGTLITIL
ncbi:MAG: Ig-like domain-containing protein [bacterium]